MLKQITYLFCCLLFINTQANFFNILKGDGFTYNGEVKILGYTILRPESKIYIPERLAYFASGAGISLATCFIASKITGKPMRKRNKRNITPEELADLKYKYILSAQKYNQDQDDSKDE